MNTTTLIKSLVFVFCFAFATTMNAQSLERPVSLVDLNQAFIYNTNELAVSAKIERTVIPVGTQFVWDFGDGNIGITQSNFVYHEYAADGTYPITVTFLNNGQQKYIRQFVQVKKSVGEELGGGDPMDVVVPKRQ